MNMIKYYNSNIVQKEIVSVDENKAGLTLGSILAGWHLIWVLLVFMGAAQRIYDFIMWVHMIDTKIIIGPFNLLAATTLIIFTAIFGYILGYSGAVIINKSQSSIKF